jgi:membrane associated rhomboid family serine protease
MLLLPYGHEQTTVRRLPWVTIGIMAACVLAFVLSGRWEMNPVEDRRVQEQVVETLEFYAFHPYLELDDEFEQTFLDRADDRRMAEMMGYLSEFGKLGRSGDHSAEQEELDALSARALESLNGHTLRRWGLIPAERRAVSWISHMFLHAGWLHLIGNLLILFLAGPFIEDVWGRPIYLGFYVVSGLLAAFFHVLSIPEAQVPMIGASGAIAGVMGAFLLRYGRTKIKFFYLVMFVIRGTFRAPAWLMIPLWFVCQVWMGLLTSELGVQAGVAYWAHIGGFVAGVGVAWLMASLHIEERFVHENIQQKITLEVAENRDVVEALTARRANPERAFRMLSLAVMNQPGNHDGAAAMWDLAKELGCAEQAAPSILRSVAHQLRDQDPDLALDQWLDVLEHVPGMRGDPALLVRVAQALHEAGHAQKTIDTLRLALPSGEDRLEPGLAFSIARVARRLDVQTAREAVRLALAGEIVDPDLRRRAEQLMQELPPEPPSSAIPLVRV